MHSKYTCRLIQTYELKLINIFFSKNIKMMWHYLFTPCNTHHLNNAKKWCYMYGTWKTHWTYAVGYIFIIIFIEPLLNNYTEVSFTQHSSILISSFIFIFYLMFVLSCVCNGNKFTIYTEQRTLSNHYHYPYHYQINNLKLYN